MKNFPAPQQAKQNFPQQMVLGRFLGRARLQMMNQISARIDMLNPHQTKIKPKTN